MFQLSIIKLEIKSCPMKKIFEISQLLTWYYTISAEGAEDWWWRCWTKSFQTFRFVAVSSPPTTWSRTTDHFPPIIHVIWVLFQIQSHFVNALKKGCKAFPKQMKCAASSVPCVVHLHRDGAPGSERSKAIFTPAIVPSGRHLSIVFHIFSSFNMQPCTWY